MAQERATMSDTVHEEQTVAAPPPHRFGDINTTTTNGKPIPGFCALVGVEDQNGLLQPLSGVLSNGVLTLNVSTAGGGTISVAGQYNLTKPVLTDGATGPLELGTHGDLLVTMRNLLTGPSLLFDQLANQAGTTQSAKLFPTTIAIAGGALPAKNSGTVGITALTQGGNTVGAVLSPRDVWGSVLLDIAGVGAIAGKTVTLEIGRIKASGGIPDVLASVVLTTSGTTLGPTAINPFTGAAHSSQTWDFFDAVTITALSPLADVLVSVSGVSGNGPAQLRLNVHDSSYYYVLITALDGLGFTLAVDQTFRNGISVNCQVRVVPK